MKLKRVGLTPVGQLLEYGPACIGGDVDMKPWNMPRDARLVTSMKQQ
jgi:hypothetical protein